LLFNVAHFLSLFHPPYLLYTFPPYVVANAGKESLGIIGLYDRSEKKSFATQQNRPFTETVGKHTAGTMEGPAFSSTTSNKYRNHYLETSAGTIGKGRTE
jgi:hypothetical protein